MSSISVSPEAQRQPPEITAQTSPNRPGDQDGVYETTRQIVRACMRCRKQKSKCDAFRPCSMCVKAGVVCVNRSSNDVQPEGIGCDLQTIQSENPPLQRPTKVRRITKTLLLNQDSPPTASPAADGTIRRTSHSARAQSRSIATPSPELGGSGGEDRADSTAKMSSMNPNLFTLTPGHLMENQNPVQARQEGNYPSPAAVLGGERIISGTGVDSTVSPSATSTIIDPQYPAVLPWSYSRASTASLLAQLPIRPVTDYLITVYFNTVHWFMVVLHEGHFLYHYRTIMDLYAQNTKMPSKNTDEDFTFAILILTVVVLGGRYTSTHSARAKRCLEIHNRFHHMSNASRGSGHDDFDIVKVTSRLFSIVRSNTTDNLACGTLATVQSFLLLSSVCLYHGESNLAWAFSGSTIRTAQALGLHKDGSEQRWNSPYYQNMDLQERCQLRRRLFWAVHTSDRFLAMCYGLPLVISDDDCLAGAPCEDNIYPPPECSSFLMIEDDLAGAPYSVSAPGGRPVTLLTYQTYKLHIYIILGDIISSLYRQSSGAENPLLSKFGPTSMFMNGRKGSSQSKANYLIEMAQRLEAKLQSWYADLPESLRLSPFDMSYPAYNELVNGDQDYNEDEDDEIVIPAHDDPLRNSSEATRWRRRRIRAAIYGLQALLLQLAYDNALILIHRPILALRSGSTSTTSGSGGGRGNAWSEHTAVPDETFDHSVDACWRAALRISRIGNHHIFQRGQQAHAISYVGIHLFTAGVVLGVFANSDPLGRRGLAAKQALRRVIAMQRRLRRKVVVAGQGLAILENLAREVMRKEVETILAQDTDAEDRNGRWGIARVEGPAGESNRNNILDQTGEPGARGGPALATSDRQLIHAGEERHRDAYYISDNMSFAQDDLANGLGTNFTSDFALERDMFNESILDIERLLSDSQFLSASGEAGLVNDLSVLNTGAQSTSDIWWIYSE